MNEDIEYFKRFARCYLMWSHSNFDRIVKDAVRRQERIKAEADEAKRREKFKPMVDMFKATNEMAKKWLAEERATAAFFKDVQWGEANFKLGSTLKIRLPSEPPRPLPRSALTRLIERVTTWLKLLNIKR